MEARPFRQPVGRAIPLQCPNEGQGTKNYQNPMPRRHKNCKSDPTEFSYEVGGTLASRSHHDNRLGCSRSPTCFPCYRSSKRNVRLTYTSIRLNEDARHKNWTRHAQPQARRWSHSPCIANPGASSGEQQTGKLWVRSARRFIQAIDGSESTAARINWEPGRQQRLDAARSVYGQ